MSKTFGNILKFCFSLGLGILIIWLTVRQLSPADIAVIKGVFKRTKYLYIFIGLLFWFASHIVRAERWKMLLNSVGHYPGRANVNYSVFVMYALNLALHHAGEVTRCTLLYRTDGVPMDKSIGTLVLERIVDTLSVLLIALLVLILDWNLFSQFMRNKILPQPSLNNGPFLQPVFLLVAIAAGVVLVGIAGWLMYKKREHAVVIKIRGFIWGMKEGLLSARNLKNPGQFILYSLLIWVMYICMIYAFYQSVSETSSLGLVSVLAIVFFSGVAYAITHGGIGVFPAMIALVLLLYAVPYDVGFAFGWLVWVTQTVAAVICGVIAFILVKRNLPVESGAQGI